MKNVAHILIKPVFARWQMQQGIIQDQLGLLQWWSPISVGPFTAPFQFTSRSWPTIISGPFHWNRMTILVASKTSRFFHFISFCSSKVITGSKSAWGRSEGGFSWLRHKTSVSTAEHLRRLNLRRWFGHENRISTNSKSTSTMGTTIDDSNGNVVVDAEWFCRQWTCALRRR